MHRRPPILLALVSVLALGAASASAEDRIAPDGTVIHRSKLENSCQVSLDRFCPELADPPGQTRNEIICLKPYRSSLPIYCRAALNAATK